MLGKDYLLKFIFSIKVEPKTSETAEEQQSAQGTSALVDEMTQIKFSQLYPEFESNLTRSEEMSNPFGLNKSKTCSLSDEIPNWYG